MELKAYQAYQDPGLDTRYWRTSTGFEVDFILNEMEVAIEVKSTSRLHGYHTKGLRALLEEHRLKKALIVSLESEPRKTEDAIEILP